ncbi:ZIP family metal transporter [Archangium sp.]|uniref:ZIP family metal transporter n=1 Tax=Archangium sp. TaxID=1872627 RepID=UPI00286BF9DE|nr:ZIP family metal transporter [Archangium sp.]
MPLAVALSSYSLVILLGAVLGALVVVFTNKQARLVTFLAFAAGVMFGAAFFHLLPEAYHGGGMWTFGLVPAGFIFLLVLDRYVMTHACEDPVGCQEHQHVQGKTLGMTAFLGLSAHTVFDGIALGSAVKEGVGLMALLAITSHKVPSSLSLASILKAEGKSTGRIMGFAVMYGLMVPIGAGLYFAFDAVLSFDFLAARALAFSAGTFLYVAVLDLIPHVSRHGRDRWMRNLAALTTGLLLMLALAQVTQHGVH